MKKLLTFLMVMALCMSMSTGVFAAAPSITDICAGEGRSYAVLSDGSLYMWGYGVTYDTIGVEYHMGPWSNKPVKVESGIMAAGNFTGRHGWRIKTDGSYWEGSVFDAPEKRLSNAVAAEKGYVLLSDGTLWHTDTYDVSKAASGVKDFSVYLDGHFAVLKTDGSVWLMEENAPNPLGSPAERGVLSKFVDGAIDVELGYANLYVVKQDGSLWGWGDNLYGQLGQGHDYDLDDYKAYHIMDDVVSVETSGGGTSVFAIKEDGSLWAWGNGASGRLGIGARGGVSYSEAFRHYTGSVGTPTKVMDDVAAVSSSGHTLILKKDGSLWACGSNTSLAVGDGAELELRNWGDHSQDRLEPVKISLGVETGKYVEPSKFVDVKVGAYYFEPVQWAVAEGITSGTSSTTFSPDQTCTRGQIITLLWNAAGSPTPKKGMSFQDVNQNMYYAKATEWAAEKGIAQGTNFYPDAPCTREMAVEFMWKYAGSPDAAQAYFKDVDAPAVDWAVAEGITSGTSSTTFSPDLTCTRGHIVTFLYKGFGK